MSKIDRILSALRIAAILYAAAALTWYATEVLALSKPMLRLVAP